ncbi:hypothetical protein V1264_019680 [Littorina saxatilis]|uniref:Uncharacterized protein n=1 Tax=Littorina saxatilis TaxID=31220 RepID=A0AAN9BH18_9CAEN
MDKYYYTVVKICSSLARPSYATQQTGNPTRLDMDGQVTVSSRYNKNKLTRVKNFFRQTNLPPSGTGGNKAHSSNTSINLFHSTSNKINHYTTMPIKTNGFTLL